MPRAFSSGALSMESKLRNFTLGLCLASVCVIAAVKVVLPWSMCPMVPTLQCGLLRSNFSFAMYVSLSPYQNLRNCLALRPAGNLFRHALGNFLIPPEVHSERPAPLCARAQFRGVSEHLRKRHHR